ncbi:MAG: hypothetical protein R3B45_02220 [Bdellovibrionota bacterium]
MSKVWLVHRKDQTYGPWPAARIREELRQGTIDPFDLVNLEGSPVMREIIEVDEIFNSADTRKHLTQVSYQAESNIAVEESRITQPSDSFLALADPNVENRINRTPKPKQDQATGIIGKIRKKDKAKTRIAPKSEANISYELAKNLRSKASSSNVSSGKESKRYYLIDTKGRILGPHSAYEVQSMYAKGQLDNSITVKKSQSEVSVPIAKFINVYAQARGASSSNASPRAINKQSFNKTDSKSYKKFQYISAQALTGLHLFRSTGALNFFIAGLILATLFWGGIHLFDIPPLSEIDTPSISTGSTPIKKSIKQESSLYFKEKKDVSDSNIKKSIQSPEIPIKEMPTKKQAVEKKESASGSTSTVTNQFSNNNKGGGRLRRPSETPKRSFSFTKTTQRSTRNKIVPINNLNPQVSPPPRTTQISTDIASALAQPGQIVTVGPLSFSPDALNHCELKCEITMVESSGAKINIKFFKEAFNNQLAGRSKKVYVTGRMAQDGKYMLLQNVK